jgi:hypothetical protein
MSYVNRPSRVIYFAIRCWRCRWMFNRPAEQSDRLTCRACESKTA